MKALLGFVLGAIVIASVGSALYLAQERYDAENVTSISDGISDLGKKMEQTSP